MCPVGSQDQYGFNYQKVKLRVGIILSLATAEPPFTDLMARAPDSQEGVSKLLV